MAGEEGRVPEARTPSGAGPTLSCELTRQVGPGPAPVPSLHLRRLRKDPAPGAATCGGARGPRPSTRESGRRRSAHKTLLSQGSWLSSAPGSARVFPGRCLVRGRGPSEGGPVSVPHTLALGGLPGGRDRVPSAQFKWQRGRHRLCRGSINLGEQSGPQGQGHLPGAHPAASVGAPHPE